MNNELSKIIIANDQSHHIFEGKPLYMKRFISVLKFHPPGLAAVLDNAGAYHVDVDGEAIYLERYTRTFGFYDERAAVVDGDNWFHIFPTGERVYQDFYSWCGNFQDGVCAVRDFNDYYFHINGDGKRLYKEKYRYAGDFKDGIAVAQNQEGLYFHIYRDGILVHDKYFYDLDIFHKGFARAKDDRGWCHIDLNGRPIYSERYNMIEPFYNGFARVEDEYGAILIINEVGEVVKVLKDKVQTPLQQLSADLVGYWKTQTIKAAVELKIFDLLPAADCFLSEKTGLKLVILRRILRALVELDLIYQENDLFYPTEKGKLLRSDHDLSLATAASHWATEHYLAWMKLTDSLKQESGMYADKNGSELFDWLDQDKDILQRYQTAMSSYAKHDYKSVADKIDLSRNKIVIDAGGGQGALLDYILEKYKHLEGVLLERNAVVNDIIASQEKKSFCPVSFDLFTKWPRSSDVVFLSRVLHDWNDVQSVKILKRAREALLPNGTIYLIEMLLDDSSGNGGMLDLNMLVIAGGSERTKEQFADLAKRASLKIDDVMFLDGGNYILKLVNRDE